MEIPANLTDSEFFQKGRGGEHPIRRYNEKFKGMKRFSEKWNPYTTQ
jgi:hypothetical protein